jgi:hypothetical protein
LNMTCRLANNVQVRKEDWGLLLYSQPQHKACFVRSGHWLYPQYFDGTWTIDGIIDDVARRTGTPAEIIERSIQKLAKHLTDNRMIVNELC